MTEKQIQTLIKNVQIRHPDIKASIDEPLHPEGEYFIDVCYKSKGVVIQWKYDGPFGVSLMRSDSGIGEKPDQLFSDMHEAIKRTLELLEC